jgi:drug/metabolite transporter (DMT)-like permease
MKQPFFSQILLVVWVGLMASSFVISADLIPYANSITSTGLRFLLATVMMLPLILVNYQPLSKSRILLQYGLMSIFLVLFFIGLFEALKTTTAARVAVIYTLVPLISLIFSHVILRDKVDKVKLIGFLLGTFGAILFLLANAGKTVVIFVWYSGDSIFFLSCCSLSMHVVLVKKWGAEVPAAQGAFYIMLLGGLMLVPMMLIMGDLDQVAWQVSEFWWLLVYLTLFTTMGTFFLQQYLIQKLGPSQLLAFTYLIPILVALSLGWQVIYQSKQSLAGILIILLALYLIANDKPFRQWNYLVIKNKSNIV